jgi:quercetin dioxygenase-like cupin family protein
MRRFGMRCGQVIHTACVLLLWALASTPHPAPQTLRPEKATPLILEKSEGERRVWRGWPQHPEPGPLFVLKVDRLNGGSSHLVFGTEDLAPGGKLDAHRHPGADELLLLQTGTAEVHLGDSVRIVHGGATVFIPADTWISVNNIGDDVVSVAFAFSAPGFEEFMRDESVREGERNMPLSKAEDDEIQRKHAHDVVYR